MPSGDPPSSVPVPPRGGTDPSGGVPTSGFEELEARVLRLLETVVRLREANAHLMRENGLLKNRVQDRPAAAGDPELPRKYEKALRDLQTVRENLKRLEAALDRLEAQGEPAAAGGDLHE